MLAQTVVDNLADLIECVGYDCIVGTFSARTGDEEEGQIELLVGRDKKFLIWFLDNDNRLVGRWDEGHGVQRLVMGDQVEIEEKMALINSLAVRIQQE